MKTHANTLIALAALAVTSAYGKIKIPFSESIDLEGIERVEIHIFSGHTDIVGDDQTTLDLQMDQVVNTDSQKEAEEWVEELEKNIEVRSNVLLIEFKHPNNKASSFLSWGNTRGYLELSLSLPSDMDLEVKTSGGHIKASHLGGELEMKTSGGHLDFNHISGALSARTSGGHIEAKNLEAYAKLHTSGGHINVDTASDNLELSTSGGHINIHNVAAHVNARTSGGHIKASFPNGFEEKSSLRTSGGSITAKVPSSHSFDLNASTSGGGVNVDSDFSFSGEKKRSKADGSINGGGPQLELRTSGGSINVSTI